MGDIFPEGRGALGSILIGVLCSVACGSTGSTGPGKPGEATSRVSAAVKGTNPNDVASCAVSTQGSVTTVHIVASSVGGAGGNISYVDDRTLDIGGASANVAGAEGFASYSETGTVQIGGSEVYTATLTATAGQPAHATVHWGPHVHGATDGTFDLNNNILTGNIDGRGFEPFLITGDPATAQFVDGGRDPLLQSNGPLSAALARLQQPYLDALAQCASSAAALLPKVSGPTTDSDPGHFSDTYGDNGCRLEKAGCAVGSGVGTGACLLLTSPACAASFGLVCGLCVAGGVAAVTSCIAAVEAGGTCCPTHCGRGFPSTCCFGDESCLNGNGLCCSAGKTACHSTACCGSDEDCQAGGRCCPSTEVAGHTFACNGDCCTAGEDCQNHTQPGFRSIPSSSGMTT